MNRVHCAGSPRDHAQNVQSVLRPMGTWGSGVPRFLYRVSAMVRSPGSSTLQALTSSPEADQSVCSGANRADVPVPGVRSYPGDTASKPFHVKRAGIW